MLRRLPIISEPGMKHNSEAPKLLATRVFFGLGTMYTEIPLVLQLYPVEKIADGL